MGHNWEYAIQEAVQANSYIRLPSDIRAVVGDDHPLDGPSVHWNYQQEARYVVLSERPLNRPKFVHVGRYKIYEDGEEENARIRPPDRLAEVIRSQFSKDERVVFLAYEEMVDNDNSMVYLLSTSQMLQLLPDAAASDVRTPAESGGARVEGATDGGVSLREVILKIPGILPPL